MNQEIHTLHTNSGEIVYRQVKVNPPQKPGLIFLGGFAASMEGTKASFLMEEAKKEKRACVVFDYFGHGRSGGKFQDGTLSIWLQNALDVLDQLTEGPQIVIGSSMGGWLMLLLAQRRASRIAKLIGIAPAPHFTEAIWAERLSPEEKIVMEKEGTVKTIMGENTYVISKSLIDDGRKHFLTPHAYRCPLHLMHSKADAVVPWSVSVKVLEHARTPFSNLMLVHEGDHRMNRPEDLDLLASLIRTESKKV